MVLRPRRRRPDSGRVAITGRTAVPVLILDPWSPDPTAGLTPASPAARAIVELAPGIRIPYTLRSGVGVDRQIRPRTTISVNYVGGRGVALFRSINVNAPPPPLYSERPDPDYSTVRQIQSTGRQQTHALELALRGRVRKRLQMTTQYHVRTARNDTNGINSLPANNYDLTGEYGRANFYQRHRLEALGQFDAGAWGRFGAAASTRSGTPYLAGDRPRRVQQRPDQRQAARHRTRRAHRTGSHVTANLRWSRSFHFGSAHGDERPAVEVGVSAFNIANHVNFNTPVGNLSSPFFGQSTSSQPARQIQLSAGVTF